MISNLTVLIIILSIGNSIDFLVIGSYFILLSKPYTEYNITFQTSCRKKMSWHIQSFSINCWGANVAFVCDRLYIVRHLVRH